MPARKRPGAGRFDLAIRPRPTRGKSLALIEEFGGLEELVEVRWVTDDGGETVFRQSDLPWGKLFGDSPERVREATFIFSSGARLTLDYSEARSDD